MKWNAYGKTRSSIPSDYYCSNIMDLVLKDEEMLWKEACFLTRLLSASVHAAERAGREVKGILASKKLDVVEKGGKNDLQTAADRVAQQCIVGSLRKIFKGMAIIGEEGVNAGDFYVVQQ